MLSYVFWVFQVVQPFILFGIVEIPIIKAAIQSQIRKYNHNICRAHFPVVE